MPEIGSGDNGRNVDCPECGVLTADIGGISDQSDKWPQISPHCHLLQVRLTSQNYPSQSILLATLRQSSQSRNNAGWEVDAKLFIGFWQQTETLADCCLWWVYWILKNNNKLFISYHSCILRMNERGILKRIFATYSVPLWTLILITPRLWWNDGSGLGQSGLGCRGW